MSSFGHIDVRIRFVRKQCITVIQHLLSDVPVWIEGCNDRHITDYFSETGKQSPFSVVYSFCDHRTVKGKKYAIDISDVFTGSLEYFPCVEFVRISGNDSTWLSFRRHCRK